MSAGSKPVVITRLDEGRQGAWDKFVRNAPAGSFFHLSGWRDVIEGTLGHRAHYLLAETASGEILGVLPLIHLHSRLFANALISNAFCVHGGPLGRSIPVERALTQAADSLAAELGVDYLEYRNGGEPPDGWIARPGLYAGFRKSIFADPERNLAAIPRKQRAMVRKAIKLGLSSELDEGTDRFYRLYSESLRNLGTPVLPHRYFAALKRQFGPACEILIVSARRTPLAGVMSFRFGREILRMVENGRAEGF